MGSIPARKALQRLALLLFVFLCAPATAEACSCATSGSPREDAREILASSDAAVIGVLRSVRPVDQSPGPVAGGEAIFRYRLKRDYKAPLGRFVRVRASTDGASCGLPTGEGKRYALGLAGEAGDWSSGLCALMRPRAQRRIAGEQDSRPAAKRC